MYENPRNKNLSIGKPEIEITEVKADAPGIGIELADDAEEKAPAAAKKSANRPGKTNDEIIPAVPEKVSTLESPLARSHTTFYGQRK